MIDDYPMVKLILSFDYLDENGKKMDLVKKINKIGGKDKNTCLHFATQNNNKELF